MPRCGTTFLYYKLQEHPSVFVPFRKETNYFSTSYGKGVRWYLSLYKDMPPEQMGADISPKYFLHDKAIERLKAFDPDVKVVLGVRDPADFALSIYGQALSYRYGVPSFKEFLLNYTWSIGGEKIPMSLTDGFVTRRVGEYREAFGENLLLFDYRLLKRDPLALLNAIESFLGLPAHFNEGNFVNRIVNAGNRKNIRFISNLLNREFVISALDILLPKRLIMSLRNAFDKASESKKSAQVKAYLPEDVRIAEEFFSGERAVVKDLFADAEILIG